MLPDAENRPVGLLARLSGKRQSVRCEQHPISREIRAMTSIVCPLWKTRLAVPEKLIGGMRMVRCPKCRQRLEPNRGAGAAG